jgi:hypothetical protein
MNGAQLLRLIAILMTGPPALRQLHLDFFGFCIELGDFEGADLAFG